MEDETQTPGDKLKNSFRRAKSRASRACEVCHARKVRCDVTVHMPCTNCAAFDVECRLPEGRRRAANTNAANTSTNTDTPTDAASAAGSNKRKKMSKKDADDGSATKKVDDPASSPRARAKRIVHSGNSVPYPSNNNGSTPDMSGNKSSSVFSISSRNDSDIEDNNEDANLRLFSSQDTISWQLNQKTKLPGHLSFLGSASNLGLIFDSTDEKSFIAVKRNTNRSVSTRADEIDKEDLEILKLKGAFLLPERKLCDDIIQAYFEKIHPVVPVINRTKFFRQYNDPGNSPSLFLLQAILVAGSRVCRNPSLFDMSGSSRLATLTFYKRAKALFDCSYELDRVAVIQGCILLGWWSEEPQASTGNIFYWTRVGCIIAQGIGLHREMEASIPLVDRRMLRRLFWGLFIRDRASAAALGRPCLINLEDCDVPMLTLDDFLEDEPDMPSPYPINTEEALYFIHQVKLSEIMGLVLQDQYSVNAEYSRKLNRVPDVTQCDIAMANWMANLPPELKYSVKDRRTHTFLKAFLHLQYYTVLCLVHRSRMLYHGQENPNRSSIPAYPSWGIAFQAAHMITKILDILLIEDEMQDCPAFVVYTVFSAIIMLIYQTESTSPQVVEAAQRALHTCTMAMETIGRNWDSANEILLLFKVLNKNQTLRAKVLKYAKRYTSDPIRPDSKDHNDVDQMSQGSITPQSGHHRSSINIPHDFDHKNNNNNNNNNNSIRAGGDPSLPPELLLVTSANVPMEVAEFRPSQLFPDHSSASMGSNSNPPSVGSQGNTPTGTSFPNLHDNSGRSNGHEHNYGYSDMFPGSVATSVPDRLLKPMSPDEIAGGPLGTINISDWYQFLLETTGETLLHPDDDSLTTRSSNGES